MAWPLRELNEEDRDEVYLGTADGKPKVMFAVKTLPSGERVYRVIPLQRLEQRDAPPQAVAPRTRKSLTKSP